MKLTRLLLAFALCCTARPALAQLDPWEFDVYSVRTAGKGVLGLESLNSVVAKGPDAGYDGTASGTLPSGTIYRTAVEVTYGLTDKIEAAVYLNLALPEDGSFQYAGSKYRLRGSLFEHGQLPVDVGWYLELEWNETPRFDDQQLDLEFRPIFQKNVGRFSFIANPKFEKVLAGPGTDTAVEFGYATGVYYEALPVLSPGIEFYGAVGLMNDAEPRREQQHYLFTVLHGDLPGGLEYSFGPGFGLTPGSDDIIVKFNIELESLLGTAPGKQTS